MLLSCWRVLVAHLWRTKSIACGNWLKFGSFSCSSLTNNILAKPLSIWKFKRRQLPPLASCWLRLWIRHCVLCNGLLCVHRWIPFLVQNNYNVPFWNFLPPLPFFRSGVPGIHALSLSNAEVEVTRHSGPVEFNIIIFIWNNFICNDRKLSSFEFRILTILIVSKISKFTRHSNNRNRIIITKWLNCFHCFIAFHIICISPNRPMCIIVLWLFFCFATNNLFDYYKRVNCSVGLE